MSHLYTPNSANNPSQITMPDDGDLPVAASVLVPFEALADKDARKLDKISGGTVSGSLVTTSSVSHDGTSTFLVGAGVQEEHSNTPGFINGATFSIAGTVTCSRPMAMSGTLTCSNAVSAISCTGPVVVSGASGSFAVTATGGSLFSTDVSVTAKLTYSGAGHERKRAIYPAGTVDTTTDINSVDRVYYATLAANRFVKLTNTGAGVGDQIEVAISASAGAFNLQVKRNDDTVITTLRGDGVTGSAYYVMCWHNGTDWFPVLVGKNTT